MVFFISLDLLEDVNGALLGSGNGVALRFVVPGGSGAASCFVTDRNHLAALGMLRHQVR